MLGAFKLGSFPPVALRAVLFTAYVAFFLGAATYYFVVRRYFRKFSRSRLELLGKTWRFVFDEAGVRYRSKTADVRLTWRGIDSVEEGGRAVFSCWGGRRSSFHRVCFPIVQHALASLLQQPRGLRQPPKAPPLELCGADLPVTIFSALVTDDI